jgi:hypothetical protein
VLLHSQLLALVLLQNAGLTPDALHSAQFQLVQQAQQRASRDQPEAKNTYAISAEPRHQASEHLAEIGSLIEPYKPRPGRMANCPKCSECIKTRKAKHYNMSWNSRSSLKWKRIQMLAKHTGMKPRSAFTLKTLAMYWER